MPKISSYINNKVVVRNFIYTAHFECHGTPRIGRSPIKWKQRTDMIIAVDWSINHKWQVKRIKLICICRAQQNNKYQLFQILNKSRRYKNMLTWVS